MSKNKIFLFISIIFFILVFIVVLIFSIIRNNSTKEESVILPTPTTIITNPSLKLPLSPTLTSKFLLLNVDPIEDPTGKYNYVPNKRITFTFNKEINPSNFKFTINPKIDINIKFGDSAKEVVIEPDQNTFWEPNIIYTIIINQETTAVDGSQLEKNINYQIQTKPQGGE